MKTKQLKKRGALISGITAALILWATHARGQSQTPDALSKFMGGAATNKVVWHPPSESRSNALYTLQQKHAEKVRARSNQGRLSPAKGKPALTLSEVGPHYRVWERSGNEDGVPGAPSNFAAIKANYQQASAGSANRVVEISTGMNFWDGQQWSPANPSFTTAADGNGFSADRVQHKVSLAANLNGVGAVNVTSPDGIVIQSSPVAIALFDSVTGKRTIIASITDCSGVLVSSNTVVYQNAFDNVCADVIYTLERGSVSQDVKFTGRLDPSEYGFPTNNDTRIQIITEFYSSAQPEKMLRPLHVEKSTATRKKMASPDFVDEVLGFGELVFGAGQALIVTDQTGTNPPPSAPVGKEFTTNEGRHFLVESVRYGSVKKGLLALPSCSRTAVAPDAQNVKSLASVPKAGRVNEVRLAAAITQARATASSALHHSGVVIDYIATIGGTLTGTTVFRGDTTYFVSGPVVVAGSTTIEGGAVFKYPTPGTASISLGGAVTCATSSYRPAIFTAGDDDYYGETLAAYDPACGCNRSTIWFGYTGDTTGKHYANPALVVTSGASMNDLRFRYCYEGIQYAWSDSTSPSLSNCQFLNDICGIHIAGCGGGGCGCGCAVFTVNNSLFSNCNYPLTIDDSSDPSGSFWQCTFDQVVALVHTSNAGCGAIWSINNSVLANVPLLLDGSGTPSISGDYDGFYNSTEFGPHKVHSDNFPFQTGGVGNYYLNDLAGFRGKGTAINIGLANLLKTKTTYPPYYFPAFTFQADDLTLTNYVPRYVSGAPDLGYYYDALDYTFAAMIVEAEITVMPGVAVGFRDELYCDGGCDYTYIGFDLYEGSRLISQGTPSYPNIFADVQFVQEGNEYPCVVALLPDYLPGSVDFLGNPLPPPFLNLRSSKFSIPTGNFHLWGGLESYTVYFNGNLQQQFAAASADSAMYLNLRDCEFRGGTITIGKVADTSITAPAAVVWKNNLFDRVRVNIDPDWPDYGDFNSYIDMPFEAYNNLFRGGIVRLVPIVTSSGEHWAIKDNLFDKTPFEQNTVKSITHDYNGYWPCLSSELQSWQTARLSPNGANDKVLTTAPAYQKGPLGGFYLPTSPPLFNGGSRTPADAGLYHYTTRFDQTKEGAEGAGTMVNIGLHYVAATSSFIQPNTWMVALVDTDADGVPDFWEDYNGNGVQDSGEPSLTAADASGDSDGDSLTNLQEWQQGSDPTKHRHDLDGDGVADPTEFYFGTNPFRANTKSTTYNDAAYNLGAVTSEGGKRVSLTVNSATYDSGANKTTLQVTVAGAFPTESHGIYLYDSAGQYWKDLFATYVSTDGSGDHYTAVADGDQRSASFAALNDQDKDMDGLPDGYEWKVTQTIAGEPSSDGTGFPDGDESNSFDGVSNAQKWAYGLNPTVTVNNQDLDGNGIPDWYDNYLRRRLGIVGTIDPWADSDGDQVPNIVEYEIGTDASIKDYWAFLPPPTPPDETPEFQEVQLFVPYTQSDISDSLYFPTFALSSGPLGLTGDMMVQLDSGGNGIAEMDVGVAPLDQVYNNYNPFTDTADPDQLEFQKPDSEDGTLYRAIISQSVDTAERIWHHVEHDVVDALKSKTLEYVRATSQMKINLQYRKIQYFMYLKSRGANGAAMLTRIRGCVRIIQAEATKMTAVQIKYVYKYPNLDWIGRVLKAGSWVCCGISWAHEWPELKAAWEGYKADVRNHQNTAGPAILSSTAQLMLQDLPLLPDAAKIGLDPTVPIFDPIPLALYDGG